MWVLPAGLRLLATVGALLAVGGADSSSGPPHTLRVTATFGGTVSSSDGRIQCGSTCSAAYGAGRVLLLHAAAGLNVDFVRWTGDCVGTAPRCAVAVDRDISVAAVFRGYPVELSLSIGGPGTVYSEPERLACGAIGGRCAASFPAGTTVTLTPVARGDAAFRVWGPPCAGETSSCTFRLTDDTETTAAFQRSGVTGEPAPLALAVRGPTVASDPPGLSCPPVCEAAFTAGTLVTLRGRGSYDWGGDCFGFAAACTLVADEARRVSASARGPTAPPPPPAPRYGINVSVSGRGLVVGDRGIRCGRLTGTVFDCSAFYQRGQRVRLRAVETRQGRFVRWGGFCAGRAKRCELRVTSPKVVIAIFGAA